MRWQGKGRFQLVVLAVVALLAAGAGIFLFVSASNRLDPPSAGQQIAPNDWPAYMYDGGRTGFNAGETRLSPANAKDLKLLWKVKIGDGSPMAAQPIVYSGTLYIGSWDGFMYALNPADGSIRWKKETGTTSSSLCTPSKAGISSAPAATKDAIYFGGGDGNFYALNPNTGDTLWTFKLGDNSEKGGAYAWVSPFAYNGKVYTGISSFCDHPFPNGQMWGLDAATGKVAQQVHFVPEDQGGGGLWTSPTVDAASGELFVTTASANYYIPNAYSMARLDPQTLEVKDAWQIPIGVQVFDGDWGTTPTLFHDKNGALMVGASAKNGFFYAFHADNISAGPVWKAQVSDGGSCPECGEGAISSSVYAYDTLYVAAGYISLGQQQKFPGSVTAFDPTSGQIKWIHPTSAPVIPALTGANGLVVACAGDTIEVLNAVTGALVWEYATGAPIFAPATIAGGVLYVASTDGNLYAFSAGPYVGSPTPYPVSTVGSNPPGFTPFRTPVPASPLQGDEQCFDNKLCVHGAFLQFWRSNGGMARFGPPVTAELNEAGRTAQYFRNAVLKLYANPDGTPNVQLQTIDFHLMFYKPFDEHFGPADQIAGTTYFTQTQHNVPEPFISFWHANGELPAIGYPVSEPLMEYNVVDGQTRRVQYFERARLEIVTDADGTDHVEFGAIGLQTYLRRYGKLP